MAKAELWSVGNGRLREATFVGSYVGEQSSWEAMADAVAHGEGNYVLYADGNEVFLSVLEDMTLIVEMASKNAHNEGEMLPLLKPSVN